MLSLLDKDIKRQKGGKGKRESSESKTCSLVQSPKLAPSLEPREGEGS